MFLMAHWGPNPWKREPAVASSFELCVENERRLRGRKALDKEKQIAENH